MNRNNQLMEQVAAPENLLCAWRSVRSNIPSYRRKHSSGPDGLSLADFERDLPAQLASLQFMLLNGGYNPRPPLIFELKKRSGGSRQIAVLNIADRVAQRAVHQVIEPLFEPAFLPCSFGFRPGRSIKDAVDCTRHLRMSGYRWVVDGDIASCFDSLDHQLVMQKLEKRVRDDRLIELLDKWLDSGVIQPSPMNNGSGQPSNLLGRVSHDLRKGVIWALDAVIRNQLDPYESWRYEPPAYSPESRADPDRESEHYQDLEPDYYRGDPENVDNEIESRTLERKAMRQMAKGGLLLGASWARRMMVRAGSNALNVLKTPQGRALLRSGLLAGGGAAGAVVGVAAASYLLYRRIRQTSTGILQGSPLSPLLANVYLHSFDQALTSQGHKIVRFADDWVILCPDRNSSETAFNQAIIALADLQLKVNQEKTRILSPSQKLEWLGETIY